MPLSTAPGAVRHAAACALVAFAALSASRARAADLPGAELEVQRGTGAETCPDAALLSAELSPHVTVPDKNRALLLSLFVELEKDADGYLARIHVGGRKQGERTLHTSGATCEGLHDALIVALLVLLDEDREALSEPADATTVPAAPAEVPPDGAGPELPRESPYANSRIGERPATTALRPSLWLSLGSGLTHGVPLDWSTGIFFDVSVRVRALEFSAGGFWSPERHITTGPGRVTLDTFGERLRGCYVLLPERPKVRLLGCATAAVVELTGKGVNFADGRSQLRPWGLAGASAEATVPVTDRIDVGFSLAALATLNREIFSIVGVTNNKYETDWVVGLALLRVEARLF